MTENKMSGRFRGFPIFQEILAKEKLSTAEKCILCMVIEYPGEFTFSNKWLGTILSKHPDNVSKDVGGLEKEDLVKLKYEHYKIVNAKPYYTSPKTKRTIWIEHPDLVAIANKYRAYRKSVRPENKLKKLENDDFFFLVSKAVLEIPEMTLSHKLILAYIVSHVQRNLADRRKHGSHDYCRVSNADIAQKFGLTQGHAGIVINGLIKEGFITMVGRTDSTYVHTKHVKTDPMYFYDLSKPTP